jgi:hypothetical protein
MRNLANPGSAYLVYLSDGGEVTVDLTPAKGILSVEWMALISRTIVLGKAGSRGGKQVLRPPFPNDAVLYLSAE